MQRIGIRQLRAHAAAMVKRAGDGERIVITVNARPVAELAPAGAGAGVLLLDDLVARGLIRPPRRRDPHHLLDAVPVWRGARLDRLLAELRG